MAERFYKRKEVRERLRVSKYAYAQLIDDDILEKPIRLTKNGHPLHTESQLLAAERKIFERANPISLPTDCKGISPKLFNEIRETYSTR